MRIGGYGQIVRIVIKNESEVAAPT